MIMGTVIVDSTRESKKRIVVADFTGRRLIETNGDVIATPTGLFLQIESLVLAELEKHI